MSDMTSFSLAGKLAFFLCLVVVLVVGLTVGLTQAIDNPWTVFIIATAVGVTLAAVLANRFARPVRRTILALRDGVAGLKDGDFSTGIAGVRTDEIGQLVEVYNDLGDVLRRERQSLFQRELLLDTVIQTTPLALVLTNRNDRIVYSNGAARRLFRDGKPLNGMAFGGTLETLDPGFAQAVGERRDGLFSVGDSDEPQTYHLSCRRFELNAQTHFLYLFKQLTHELNRQEVATWKKVIRVISHELNNSLAPISSLAHSGGLVLQKADQSRLGEIFTTIEERARHLKTFIEGYARFARLPVPRLQSVELEPFISRLAQTIDFRRIPDELSGTISVDPAQFEQVMINLLKNAHESGSDPEQVSLKMVSSGGQTRFDVCDRGSGMSERVLKNALLPFYSTKQTGTGLGLPLCREIVEAHGGRLSLSNRRKGGLRVSILLDQAVRQKSMAS
ncbi:MAG: PAS domain-containing sensor histidine kinase [Gammaproteobacteria bacterium]